MHKNILTYLISFLCLLISLPILADNEGDNCSGTENEKAAKYFSKAGQLYNKDQEKAKEYVLKALEEDSEYVDAWYMLADFTLQEYEKNWNNSRLQSKLKAQSHRILMKILDLCPSYDNYNLNYLVGEQFYNDKDFIKADEYLSVFTKHTDKNSDAYKLANIMLDEMRIIRDFTSNPVPFDPEPVEGISTKDAEYLPLISPDGEFIFYTRQYMKDNPNSIYGPSSTEEFTVANRADSTYMHYVDARAMPSPFNRGANQGGISITIDNSTLFVTKCEQLINYEYRNCDIYISRKTAYGWSEMKNLGPNVNGKFSWESQPSISPDGKTLYFATVRPENIGSNEEHQTSDIYYTVFNDSTKTWSKAKNIGAPINTTGNEKSPFFHADNRTLYFTSDGHDGMGGFDIFYSQQIDNQWTEPTNIGYPINTGEDDLGFVVTTAGDRAYFSSNQYNGNGGYDIYGFKLYEDVRPDKVLFVKGKLINENGVTITDAKIEIQNTATREVTEGMMDNESGNYAVAMRIEEDAENDYLMVVKREGSSFTSRLFEPEKLNDTKPISVDVKVQPIETGQAVTLHDIYFDFGSSEIMMKSYIVLDNFIDFLKDNPKLKFEIHGHTDNVGDATANMKLSKDRAKSVYAYLLEKGINNNRMSYQGFGETRPIAVNETEAGRAQNRRTEFFIIDNY